MYRYDEFDAGFVSDRVAAFRDQVARELEFDGICANSLDAVSDRDFAIEFCGFAAILMMHLSRLAEELLLWSSADFAFIAIFIGLVVALSKGAAASSGSICEASTTQRVSRW